MVSDLDPQRLEIERRLGFRDGEACDRRLWQREMEACEERLSRMVWGVDEEQPLVAAAPSEPLGSLQLQDEVTRLRDYYNAVQSSWAWRLTQRLRRLVGRAW